MDITTDQIKKLRDETAVSVMQCKKALEEASGDIEKAKIILRKISKQSADKKADRELGSGVVASYIHNNNLVGVLVELNCETDFVARNDDFKSLGRDIAMHIAALSPEYVHLEDIKDEDKQKAKELFDEEASGKPEPMRAKIVEGKLSAYFAEKVLMEQNYIKNPEVTIRSLIEQANQKFGERVEVGRFVRFAIN
jgi:elongation factor Ts